jgi:hypothetical protein
MRAIITMCFLLLTVSDADAFGRRNKGCGCEEERRHHECCPQSCPQPCCPQPCTPQCPPIGYPPQLPPPDPMPTHPIVTYKDGDGNIWTLTKPVGDKIPNTPSQ